MDRRLVVLLAAVVVALVAVAGFVPAEFVASRLHVPEGTMHPPFVPSGPFWVPVWQLGGGELALGEGAAAARAEGRYVLMPLLLIGELCLVGALGGCALLVLLGGKRKAKPAA